MDPMYILPKDQSEPHDDVHVICFFSVSNFGHQELKKWFFFALAQLTDKMDPMYLDIHETFF